MLNRLQTLFKKDLNDFNYLLEKIIPSKTNSILNGIVKLENVNYFVKGFLLKSIFKNEFLKSQLNNELKICNKIKTNSIYLQKFYNFFYTKNFAIFVYEYFPKGNIDIKYKKTNLNKNELLIIIKDIFFGLEELKKLKIYHKYLSLEFIFLNKNNFKIGGYEYCEFNKGLKYSDINHYKFIQSILNLNTLSPELVFNKFTGNKTAYFSLGIIIYFLIYKKYPIKNCNYEFLKLNYTNNIFKIKLNLIPSEWRFIITNCLQIYYNVRISSNTLKEELNYLFKNFSLEKINEIRRKLFFEKTYTINNLPKINDIITLTNNNILSKNKSSSKNKFIFDKFLDNSKLNLSYSKNNKFYKFKSKKNFKFEFKNHYWINKFKIKSAR